jgi:hypothetical protein
MGRWGHQASVAPYYKIIYTFNNLVYFTQSNRGIMRGFALHCNTATVR